MSKKIGINLAVVKNQDLKFYLLNTTPYRILTTLYLEQKDSLDNLYSGMLAPKKYYPLRFTSNSKHEYKFKIGYLYISDRTKSLPTYKKWDLRFSPKKLKRECYSLPVLNRVGWLFNLHKPEPNLDLENVLKNQPDNEKPPPKIVYPFEKPPEIVDLHIEKLDRNYKKVNPKKIKHLQIEMFKQKLDEAIAYNMPLITFIHGKGNYVLSESIETYLKNHKDVKDFSKCNFNSGLTQVELRQI